MRHNSAILAVTLLLGCSETHPVGPEGANEGPAPGSSGGPRDSRTLSLDDAVESLSLASLPSYEIIVSTAGNTTFTRTTFEGGPNNTAIAQAIAGATFAGWLTLVDSDQGGSGSFAAEPSPSTVAYWRSTTEFPDHVREIALAEPVSGVSMYYADGYNGVRLEGLDAGGRVVAYRRGGFNYRHGSGGDPTGTYDAWWPLQIEVGENVITRVRMYGRENYTGIDDFMTCISGIESPVSNYEMGGCISVVDDLPPRVSFSHGFRDLTISPDPRPPGVSSILRAAIHDAASRTGPGLPYGSEIISAEFNVDGGPFQPLQLEPYGFGFSSAIVTGVIPGSSELGLHEVCVRGTDAWGNVSPTECTPFRVSDPADRSGPLISGIRAWCQVQREYPYQSSSSPCFSDTRVSASADMTSVHLSALIDDGSTGSWDIASVEYNIYGGAYRPMRASDGAFNEIDEGAEISLSPPPPRYGSDPLPSVGLHEFCIRGTDRVGNASESCFTLAVSGSELEVIADELQTIADDNPGTALAAMLESAAQQVRSAVADLARVPAEAQGAVGELKGAVGDLEGVARDGLLDPALLNDWMERLAGIAWYYASNEIYAALEREGVDWVKLEEAWLLGEEGHQLAQSNQFKDAIDKYKEALRTAQRA